MEKVIIESPDTGDISKLYEEYCLHDSTINHNESPKLNKKANDSWKKVAERIVFYCDLGMTKKMDNSIEKAKENKRYDIRWVSDKVWDKFIGACNRHDFDIPKRIEKI